MPELTYFQLWQLERYGNILPETLPWFEPSEEMIGRENDYRLQGAVLQAEVISQDLNYIYE